MTRNVYKYRRVKWGEPERKLKMLLDDMERRPYRGQRNKTTWFRPWSVPSILGSLLMASMFGVGASLGHVPLDRMWTMLPGSGCNIKGNISINTGERIYHMPGQEYYDVTRISPEHGERWFCSEDEARSAGWRKARTR